MTVPWTIGVFLAAAGLALGSFAVTAGLRRSEGRQALWGRSACDACGRTLGMLQTIPVVSYVRQSGACTACGARIDPLHLVGELAGAAVVLSAFWIASPARATGLGLLGLMLLAIAVVDLKVQRIPNLYSALVAAVCLGLSTERGEGALVAGVLWGAGTGGLLLALAAVGKRWLGEGILGLGDVKLMGALAIWLGPATPAMVLTASLLGLASAPLLARGDRRIPFGPMIALGAWTVGLVSEAHGPWL